MDEKVEVPPHFLCPISLQLMGDPVTVCTGITYDRESIERWLFSCNNTTCPVTKQSLLDTHLNHLILTPNHTLRSLIQTWCAHNSSFGIERIPTPKPPPQSTHIAKLLSEATRCPDKQLECIKTLRSIALESERNKNCLKSAGAIEFLASTMKSIHNSTSEEGEAVIEFLFHLNPSETQLRNLINNESIQFIESLVQILKLGTSQSRAHATMLLKSAFEVANPTHWTSVRTEFFVEISRVLCDQISHQASKAALKLVIELCPWGRNRIKAVEGCLVFAVIELLLLVNERRLCELMLIALDQLCGCAEGRAELVNHGGGVAVVAEKILRVSRVGSDRGVRVLASICKYLGTPRVLQEMLQVGGVSKLCLVVQVDHGSLKTKERAKEVLRLHSRVWKNSPCIPLPLISSFP